MIKQSFPYQPNYAFPPGETLLEVIEERELAFSDVAARSGLSEQQLIRLVSGNQLLTDEIAVGLSKALDIPAQMWLAMAKQYRDFLAKDAKRLARRRKTA